MKVITISGAHRGVGKTALSELLLQNLSGFAAIKITMSDVYTSVSDNEEEIMVPEKDTFRMKQSGAEKVVWVRTTEKFLPEAMEQALRIIGNPKGLLIEGNSVLKHLNPTIAFFIIDNTVKQMKPSRINALKKADVCIINQKNSSTVGEDTLQKIKSLNPKMKVLSLDLFSANNKKDENHKKLIEYLKKRTL
jgi:molybdopterin-guanine dinucleotide biosynthesis protein